MIPYADITDKADRGWTARVLARLDAADLPDDELDDLVGALQAISDQRSFVTLETILVDPARPPRFREVAGAVLGGMQYATIDVPESGGTARAIGEEACCLTGHEVGRRHPAAASAAGRVLGCRPEPA